MIAMSIKANKAPRTPPTTGPATEESLSPDTITVTVRNTCIICKTCVCTHHTTIKMYTYIHT